MKTISTAILAISLTFHPSLNAAEYEADVIIYGGTSAAVTAAVQVKKMGKSVIIVSPDQRLGGLSSGGLGFTDTGNKTVIGGLSREFYHRIYKHYQEPESWKFQKKEDYGDAGLGSRATDHGESTMWIFEPSAALKVFNGFITEYAIPVHRGAYLDREKGVKMQDGTIGSITTLDGDTFSGKVFLDTTYEGDLMAAAGVSFTVGREAKSVYGEDWAGVMKGADQHPHHFKGIPVDPYVVPGDPSSGIIPLVSAEPPGEQNSGDKRIQAYNFRVCMTNAPENRIPFPKPDNYDEKRYEVLGRVYDAGWRETFHKFDTIPNHKTDTNNHGPVSTDHIGANYDYPEASYERRREIIQEHKDYTLGWLYYNMTSERVPKDIREKMNTWGLPKDEFEETGNWSPQIYVREARRMVGSYVMTENELLQRKPTPDSVGMGAYSIDSHNTQRYISEDGLVQNEGDIGVHPKPYGIAYGALVPKKDECKNLFVTCAVSASHVAYGSIRMEPVFMILGQSAATAGVIAIEKGVPVQDVEYPDLEKKLIEDGQVLSFEGRIR